MKQAPLVSICIPTYNRGDMLSKAIESALNQSYTNIEVIVVDNASEDRTEEIVSGFHDARLAYVKNPRNLGLFGNFNRCIELASGDLIHILHSDDYIDPGFTESCVDFFIKHPSVALTFTRAKIIGKDFERDISYSTKDEVYPAPDGFRMLLRKRAFIVCPSVIVRKGVYQDVGLFSMDFPYSSDYYQWMRITRRYDVGFVSGAWLYYRQGEHTESYRLLFTSPRGYMDTLNIYIRITGELDEAEAQVFHQDLKRGIRRHMLDCLFAGATRSESMRGYSPYLFIGLAMTAWGLLRSDSWQEKVKKGLDFFIIMGGAGVFLIPGGRTLMTKILQNRMKHY